MEIAAGQAPSSFYFCSEHRRMCTGGFFCLGSGAVDQIWIAELEAAAPPRSLPAPSPREQKLLRRERGSHLVSWGNAGVQKP